jgi:hypothetical protein
MRDRYVASIEAGIDPELIVFFVVESKRMDSKRLKTDPHYQIK